MAFRILTRPLAAYRKFVLLDDELKANDAAFAVYAKELRIKVAKYGSLTVAALVVLAWPVDFLGLRDDAVLLARASLWRAVQVCNGLLIAALFQWSSWARKNANWLSVVVAFSWFALWPAFRIAAYHEPRFGIGYGLPVIGFFLILPFFSRLWVTSAIVVAAWMSYVMQYAMANGTEPSFEFPRNLAIITFCICVLGHVGYRLLRSNFNNVNFLEQRVSERTADLRRLVGLQEQSIERERARISRELHDVMGQIITRLRISVDILADEVQASPLRSRVADVSEKIDMLMSATRQAIHELHSQQLGSGTLTDLIEDYLNDVRRKCGVEIDWDFSPPAIDADSEAKLAVLRIVQEATTNALRHGPCTRLYVVLAESVAMRRLMLEVHDDGAGVHPLPAPDGHGMGVAGMRERVERLGGTFSLGASGRLGGACVSMTLERGEATPV